MRRLWPLFFVVLFALPGCKGKCRQLSEKLCECGENSAVRDRCNREASAAEGVNPPTDADEAFCASKINGCDCRVVDTAQGKVNCGLARE
jgi:hypothetical protein